MAERIHLAEQIHLWRTRSRLNCLWRTLILCNVESGNFRMTNLWNLADWQLDGNVEASERIKPSTCPFFYLLINQWSEETPFLSSLRMNQGYLFSLKVKLRPTLPTVNCLALAYSRQQVPFFPCNWSNLWICSGGSDSFPVFCLLNWSNLASRFYFSEFDELTSDAFYLEGVKLLQTPET